MIIRSTGFIDNSLITSQNVLNFAYMLYIYLKDKGENSADIQSIIRRWFVSSLLTSRYTGSVESQLDEDIRLIERHGAKQALSDIEASSLSGSFWEVTLLQELDKSGLNNPVINTFFAAQIKEKDHGFLSSDITIQDMIENRGDVHHLFPYDYLKKNGFDRAESNQIANFVYAETPVNIRVSNKSPKQYFDQIKEQIKNGKQIWEGF